MVDPNWSISELATFAFILGAIQGLVLAIVLFLMNWYFHERARERRETAFERDEYDNRERPEARRRMPLDRAKRRPEQRDRDGAYQDIGARADEWEIERQRRERASAGRFDDQSPRRGYDPRAEDRDTDRGREQDDRPSARRGTRQVLREEDLPPGGREM